MTEGPGSESYTYSNLGQMTQLQKVISGTTYTTQYAYNISGELTQITYPSGRVIAQSTDSLGRLCAVGTSGSACTTGTTYATGYTYSTAQQATGFNYGFPTNTGRNPLSDPAHRAGPIPWSELPKTFFKAMCSAMSSARTSSLVWIFFSRYSIRCCSP
jgi:hypothetical protein